MKTYSAHLPQIELKYKKGESRKVKISSSHDIFELSKTLFNTDTIEISEEVLIIYLNRANNTLGWIRHTTGGSVASIIDIKLILCTALQCGAQSLIMLHNHPSGVNKPSEADKIISLKLKKACDTLELNMLDSIIVAGEFDSYYSLADEGQLF
jgi:DNA repair protein RadC